MEVDFSKTVLWNFLKFVGHVTIIHMNLPMNHICKSMHKYQENSKMVVGDGG